MLMETGESAMPKPAYWPTSTHPRSRVPELRLAGQLAVQSCMKEDGGRKHHQNHRDRPTHAAVSPCQAKRKGQRYEKTDTVGFSTLLTLRCALEDDGQGAKQHHLKTDENGDDGKGNVHILGREHDVESKEKGEYGDVAQQRTPHASAEGTPLCQAINNLWRET